MTDGPIDVTGPQVGVGPVFITGSAGSGKTELRRLLERVPGLEMSRKTAPWATLARRTDVARALALTSSAEGRWGIQRKGLERWAEVLFDHDPPVRIVHLVRDPVASAASPRPGSRGRVLAHWANSTEVGTRHAARRSDRYRLVRVEDLAADPTSPDLAKFLSIDTLPRADDVDWSQFQHIETDVDLLDDHVRRLFPQLGYARVGGRRRPRPADLVTYAAVRTVGRIRAWLGVR